MPVPFINTRRVDPELILVMSRVLSISPDRTVDEPIVEVLSVLKLIFPERSTAPLILASCDHSFRYRLLVPVPSENVTFEDGDSEEPIRPNKAVPLESRFTVATFDMRSDVVPTADVLVTDGTKSPVVFLIAHRCVALAVVKNLISPLLRDSMSSPVLVSDSRTCV